MKLAFKIKTFIDAILTKNILAVRCIVTKDNKFLLVKHTYTHGWYHIGGGVDMGETTMQAVTRELQEEAGITCLTPPKLYDIYLYLNKKKHEQHYITLYICEDFQEANYICPIEIAQKQWFKLEELPEDTTPATRARILEYLGKAEITNIWK